MVRVTDQQVRKLREEMSKHGCAGLASMRAGMYRNTGRKYLKGNRLPSELKQPRDWRTRPDPFEADWPDIEQRLVDAPELDSLSRGLPCEPMACAAAPERLGGAWNPTGAGAVHRVAAVLVDGAAPGIPIPVSVAVGRRHATSYFLRGLWDRALLHPCRCRRCDHVHLSAVLKPPGWRSFSPAPCCRCCCWTAEPSACASISWSTM